LLQVILIGQPELQQLLKRNDLRQLAQRITARYHLLPLNLDEVRHYLKFRLQVAGCSRPVFSDGAVKRLYQLSGGIPRLVNLMADRALLGAFSQQQAIVSDKLVSRAAGEILPLSDQVTKAALPRWFWPVLGVCAIVLGFSLALIIMPLLQSQ
jgi:general secretion pathway protein A